MHCSGLSFCTTDACLYWPVARLPGHQQGATVAQQSPCNMPDKPHTTVSTLVWYPRCAAASTGVLTYQDTSTGQIVAQHRTRLGPCDVMRQNPFNAVMCCGHANGSVTMWTPNITTPVVKMLCHRGAVKALAVDPTGHHLVTAGE
eukprot:GHUV01044402.1.p1 GENE.GHUV01044402.1~~GHUV01044402.1.p1  ORF type:complete len:145 (+),score=17.92 GHUV01044402.1:184-618(+)